MTDTQQQQQQQQKEENSEKQKEEQKEDKDGKQQQQQQQSGSKSPRRQIARNPRHNKLYRTPPTPDTESMFEKESSFVLDSRAVSSISEDYSRANPKVGSVLPPYNSQKDKYVKTYFQFSGVEKTLRKNKQEPKGTCIEGPAIERFFVSGHGMQYLTPRNDPKKGTSNGYSNEERMGHGKLWRHPNPRIAEYERKPREFEGFNGRFGYRRTTPRLRHEPSPFGVNTETSIY